MKQKGVHWSNVQLTEFTSWIVSWVNSKGQYASSNRVALFLSTESTAKYRSAVDDERKKFNSILKECFLVLKEIIVYRNNITNEK